MLYEITYKIYNIDILNVIYKICFYKANIRFASCMKRFYSTQTYQRGIYFKTAFAV